MAASIYPRYPPDLSSEQLDQLVRHIQDWAIAHGLAVRPAPSFVPTATDPNVALAVTAPVTIFSSPFPRNCFEDAHNIQKAYNELYARIASDEQWLGEVVEGLIGIDDFMAKLWDVHQDVKKEGYVQELSLGLFRSDYMVHINADHGATSASIRQVEFNTIASSFGGLSSQVSALHEYLAASGSYPREALEVIKVADLVQSQSTKRLAAGIAAAHRAYGTGASGLPKAVVFVVQSPERNVFDQRHLEYDLHAQGIRAYRLPFAQVLVHTKLDSHHTLIFTPPHSPSEQYEVTTLYYRAGYDPSDYATTDAWQARRHLERSRAIKCPSILTHLAGAKKVQQVLATPDSPYLSKFITSQSTAQAVASTFAPIYPLDASEAGKKAQELALNEDSAARYVLKPQREGGGNNVYRRKIPAFLRSIPETQWPAYILMEMIEPPALNNAILRNGTVEAGGVINELGVYGTVLWRNKLDGRGSHAGVAEVLLNEQAGYLLRTKGDASEEGGVAAGFGAVDSVLLVDT